MGKKRIVGVDVGSDAIRAVEVLGADSKHPVVTRYQEAILPDGAVKSGEVIESNTVASVLRQLWSSAGFKSKDVVLGVGNPKVLVRDLTVPKLGLKEIRQSLPFQVQEMLPVPVSEALLDFYPISEANSDSGPVVNGLLVAAVKTQVENNVNAIRLAGLSPVAVDLIPFALSRVVENALVPTTIALVDIGARTTNVVVAAGGVPQFVRIIPTGSSDITAAIAHNLEVSVEQAEGVKRRLGLTSPVQSAEDLAAVETIRQLTGDLLNSVRNTLSYYINTRPGTRLERIVLSGGGSRLSGVSDALAEVTRLAVDTGDPFDRMSIAKSVRPDSYRPSMNVALGLALGSAA